MEQPKPTAPAQSADESDPVVHCKNCGRIIVRHGPSGWQHKGTAHLYCAFAVAEPPDALPTPVAETDEPIFTVRYGTKYQLSIQVSQNLDEAPQEFLTRVLHDILESINSTGHMNGAVYDSETGDPVGAWAIDTERPGHYVCQRGHSARAVGGSPRASLVWPSDRKPARFGGMAGDPG